MALLDGRDLHSRTPAVYSALLPCPFFLCRWELGRLLSDLSLPGRFLIGCLDSLMPTRLKQLASARRLLPPLLRPSQTCQPEHGWLLRCQAKGPRVFICIEACIWQTPCGICFRIRLVTTIRFCTGGLLPALEFCQKLAGEVWYCAHVGNR